MSDDFQRLVPEGLAPQLPPDGYKRLGVVLVFGVGVPIAFLFLGISESITMASMGLGGLYIGANTLSKKYVANQHKRL